MDKDDFFDKERLCLFYPNALLEQEMRGRGVRFIISMRRSEYN